MGQGQSVGEEDQLNGSAHHEPVVDVPELDVSMEERVVAYMLRLKKN